MKDLLGKLKIIFIDIKIQHTVFALPFAVMSAFLAAGGMPRPVKLWWIIVAMFGARSSAMAFNRIVDSRFDAANRRTRDRALPAGKVNVELYWVFLVMSSALFIFASAMLNRLAFMLSPVALAIVFFYSFTKRFTSFSHVFLGIALSVAPVGAWVAIREEISLLSLIMGAAVVFWLTGFDIIYSCMDVEFDAKNNLFSLPRRFGVEIALKFAYLSHILMVVFLFLLLLSPLLGKIYFFGVWVVAGFLWFEHSLVKNGDLSKVNMAFFNVNGVISVFLMFIVIVECMW